MLAGLAPGAASAHGLLDEPGVGVPVEYRLDTAAGVVEVRPLGLRDGEPLLAIKSGRPLRNFAVNHAGNMMVAATSDSSGALRVFHPPTGRELAQVAFGVGGALLAFAEDDEHLAAAEGGEVAVWAARSLREAARFRLPGGVEALRPDGGSGFVALAGGAAWRFSPGGWTPEAVPDPAAADLADLAPGWNTAPRPGAVAAVEGALRVTPAVDWWKAWSLDPTAAVALFLAWCYARGVPHYRGRRGFSYPPWRLASFAAGLLVLLLALCSPVDYFADRLFLMHMVQHLSLIMVAVPLLLLGRPLHPILKGAPRLFRRAVVLPLAHNPVWRAALNFLTHPLVAVCHYVLAIWFWHFPFFYNLALDYESWHLLSHAHYFWVAVFFSWNIIEPAPLKNRLAPGAKMLVIVTLALQNSVLSSLLCATRDVHYGYISRPPLWGLTHLEDQAIGGIIMWVPGGMMYLLTFSLVFMGMVRRHRRDDPLPTPADPAAAAPSLAGP